MTEELEATIRLLPYPQQLHDASFMWMWIPSASTESRDALRSYMLPLLQDLLAHRLPDSTRHTLALDRAALTAVRNLISCGGFEDDCLNLLASFSRYVEFREQLLDVFVEACMFLADSGEKYAPFAIGALDGNMFEGLGMERGRQLMDELHAHRVGLAADFGGSAVDGSAPKSE